MVIRCAAPNCNQKYIKNGDVKFHLFPADEDRKKIWVQNCKKVRWMSQTFLCSLHFEDNQYEQHRIDGKKRLRHNAVPTIFNSSHRSSLKYKNYESHAEETKDNQTKIPPSIQTFEMSFCKRENDEDSKVDSMPLFHQFYVNKTEPVDFEESNSCMVGHLEADLKRKNEELINTRRELMALKRKHKVLIANLERIFSKYEIERLSSDCSHVLNWPDEEIY